MPAIWHVIRRQFAYFKRLALAANHYIYATPGALEALSEAGQGAADFLNRYQRGDWSEMCEEDKRENEFSVDKNGIFNFNDG
jgi:hypothetical protein